MPPIACILYNYENSRVRERLMEMGPSHIIAYNLRTLGGAKLHRQSMQDNKLGNDKKKKKN